MRFLLLLLLIGPCWALPKKLEFVRVSHDSKGKPISLDTAITRVVSSQGWTVDLVGAVHLGEKEYYDRLNSDFRAYDAVLYELIADSSPGQKPIPVAGDTSNPLSALQSGLCKMLGLQFQLDWIDYRPTNFIHADISPDEFAKSMEKRHESMGQMLLRILKASAADSSTTEEDPGKDLDLIGIMLHGPSPKDRHILRLMMADSFTNLDQLNDILNGPNGSTLLHTRNDKALKVLRREIQAGKRHLAIFYGAAHMPDMLAKLRKDPAVKLGGQRWLFSWDLKERKKLQEDKR